MDTWWGWSEFDVRVSKIIDRAEQPLVISDMPLGAVMPLGHRLKPNTKILLLTEPESLKIPETFRNVFVYNPTKILQSEMSKQKIDRELIYQFKDNSLIVSLYKLQLPK
jgi:hypothetical protein